MNKKFLDTCSLLESEDLNKINNFLISSKTIEELEMIKVSSKKDEEIKFKARRVVRWLDNNKEKYEIIMVTNDCYDELMGLRLENNNDNLIISSAYLYSINTEPVEFYSQDILCRFIAKTFFDLKVKFFKCNDDDIYKGYKVIENVSDEDLVKVYNKSNNENIFDCLLNEYAILKNIEDIVVDIVRWNGDCYNRLNEKQFKSRMFGNIKPLDEVQRCVFDSINNNDITVIYGKAGSGKTTIPMAYIWQGLETQKINKCHIIYHFEPLKGSKTLGFEKGSHVDKLLSYGGIGNILSTKIGDIEMVKSMINTGSIDIVPTANIRGVEYGNQDVVYITEGQDLDTYTLKTIIQRCKQGCKIIIEGDWIEQSDINRKSGMTRLIEVFKNHKNFGCIKLKHVYRSDLCELADKM